MSSFINFLLSVSQNQQTLDENNKKTRPPDSIFELEMHEKACMCGWSFDLDSLVGGWVTALPRSNSWINGRPL